MYTLKIVLTLVLAVTALVQSHSMRVARSPASAEATMPNYSGEDLSKPTDSMREEGEYWQGEGEKNEMNPQDRNPDENQKDFEDEREYREDRHDKNNEQMQGEYQEGRDDMEDRQQTERDHNDERDSNRNDPDIQGGGQKANDNMNSEIGEKGERYNEKGQQEMNDRENTENPSLSYTRD